MRLLSLLFLGFALLSSGHSAVEVEVANHSGQPVYSSLLQLDAATVYDLLNVPPGSPLAATKVANGSPVPIEATTVNSVSKIRLYISLAPRERQRISISQAASWTQIHSASWDSGTSTGQMTNGLVAVTVGPSGIQIAQAGSIGTADDRAIARNVHFKGWLDEADNGAIVDPVALGLKEVITRHSPLASGRAMLTRDGPGVILTREFDGMGAGVELTERIVALYGVPAVRYALYFTNHGQTDRWLAWADNHIAGNFAREQRWLRTPYWGTSLFDLSQGSFADHVKWWYNPPSWTYCATWNEEGRGVGMVSLQPLTGNHYHNKTYWRASRTGFTLEQVETVAGYPPIRIAPGETIEVGAHLLATDAGVSPFRQTGLFFQSLGGSGVTPRYETPYAARLNGEVIKGAKADSFLETFEDVDRWFVEGALADPGGSGVEVTLDGSTATLSSALETGFSEERMLGINVAEASSGMTFEVSLRRLDTNETNVLIHVTGAEAVGGIEVPVSQLTGWSGFVEYELQVKINGQSGQTATIAEVWVLPVAAPAPEPVSPLTGWDVTDIALCFSWKGLPNIEDYRIQVSANPGFDDPVEFEITSDSELCTYHVVEPLTPGTWYWRVAGIDGDRLGGFSPAIEFTINNDLPKAELIRPIDVERPLFTLEAQRVPDLGDFAEAVPSDIRPYTAILSGNQYFVHQNTDLEHFSKVAGQDNLFLLRTHGPGRMAWTGMSLTDVEWLFQNYPNIIGIGTGENFWNYWLWETDGSKEYITRLIQLCAKYGRLYLWADGNGTTFKWQQFASNDYWIDVMEEYGDYLIFSLKNNVNHTMHTSQGALMGLWLSGKMAHHGSWSEFWYWNDAGFAGLNEYLGPKMGILDYFPRNFYNLSFMHGIAQGATVFSVDGQGTTGTTQAAIWNRDGVTTATFHDYVVPFIRGVVSRGMVPTKEEVLEEVKVAIRQPDRFQNVAHHGDYGIYRVLYEETYGFRENGRWYEYFPNTSRYYYIPLLPYGVDSLPNSARVEPLAAMSDPAFVRAVFDEAYPGPHYGDALHNRVGNSLFIQNTNENVDDDETYDFRFSEGSITRLAGDVGVHHYILGKLERDGERLWLQSNGEYREREFQLTLEASRRPALRVDPEDGIVSAEWDETTSIYTVVWNHLHGAVEIEFDTEDDRWESWADEAGLEGADRLPDADPDGDGISNLWEFVLVGDPLRPGREILPVSEVVRDAGGETEAILFRFFKRTDAEETVELWFEYSTDLGDWTPLPVEAGLAGAIRIEISREDEDRERVEIEIPATEAVDGRMFYRLRTNLK